MDNIKNDSYYLERIKADLKFVMDHTQGKTKEDLEKDADVQLAVSAMTGIEGFLIPLLECAVLKSKNIERKDQHGKVKTEKKCPQGFGADRKACL
jgi:hypothetical protein